MAGFWSYTGCRLISCTPQKPQVNLFAAQATTKVIADTALYIADALYD